MLDVLHIVLVEIPVLYAVELTVNLFCAYNQYMISFTSCVMLQSLVRALQGDLVPKEQQLLVQSATVVMSSLGDLFANAIVQLFEEPIAQIRLIFLITVLLYTATITTILWFGHETPVSTDIHAHCDTTSSPYNVLAYFRNLPSWLWRIGGTYALGFFCFFCVLPYASSWIASSVMGGKLQTFI